MLQALHTQKVCLLAKSVSAGFALDDTFVLIPLQNVQVRDNGNNDDNDDDNDNDNDDDGGDSNDGTKKKQLCLRRQRDEMNRQLESEIDTSFEFAKWNVAKNLMREILKCPTVCISSDFCLAYVDRQEFSIIDFLQVATRKSGPKEASDDGRHHQNRRQDFVARFVPLLAVLLANHAPVSYIKNKRLHNLTLKYMQSRRGV